MKSARFRRVLVVDKEPGLIGIITGTDMPLCSMVETDANGVTSITPKAAPKKRRQYSPTETTLVAPNTRAECLL